MNFFKLNLYKDLKLDTFYWGGAVSIIKQIDLNSKVNIISSLDQACKGEELNPLIDGWNEINYNQFKELLTSALQFNLGFLNHEVMPIEKATHFFKVLTTNYDHEKCRCFTNAFDNPWTTENGSFSYNSVSKYTLDLALTLVNEDKLLLIYFFFED